MSLSIMIVPLSLSFAAFSEEDITLVINDPLGRWVCNDDFMESDELNPGISFEDPESGKFDIWLGVYSSDEDDLIDANLFISELSLDLIFETYEGAGSGIIDESSVSGQSGTGFIVNEEGHILTNHHVIEGCTDITFQIRRVP